MNQLDVLQLPVGLRQRMLSIFYWRSKISFEILLIPSHTRKVSPVIMFGHAHSTKSQNRTEGGRGVLQGL